MSYISETLCDIQRSNSRIHYEQKLSAEERHLHERDKIVSLYEELSDCHCMKGAFHIIGMIGAIVGIVGAAQGIEALSAVTKLTEQGTALLSTVYESKPEILRGILAETQDLLNQENSHERDGIETARELKRMIEQVIEEHERAKSKILQPR